MAEDDQPVTHAVEHPLLARLRLGREALYVRLRRAMDVEHAVELGLRRQAVEPVDHVVG